MKVLLIAIIAVVATGCGDVGRFVDCIDGCSMRQGPQGVPGEVGADGIDGANGNSVALEKEDLVIEASRSYGPSIFSPTTSEAFAGFFKFPETLELVSGAAGTGWASITLEDARLCYQGNGANNQQAGDSFLFKKVVVPSAECFNGAAIANSLSTVLLMSGEAITLSLHGGGISSALQPGTHVVKAVIKSNIIKN